MTEETGKFYCSNCKKTEITIWNGRGLGYRIWKSKMIDKIKKWQFGGFALNGGVWVITEEQCWKTSKERDKNITWECSNCKTKSNTFIDFIASNNKTKVENKTIDNKTKTDNKKQD